MDMCFFFSANMRSNRSLLNDRLFSHINVHFRKRYVHTMCTHISSYGHIPCNLCLIYNRKYMNMSYTLACAGM